MYTKEYVIEKVMTQNTLIKNLEILSLNSIESKLAETIVTQLQ